METDLCSLSTRVEIKWIEFFRNLQSGASRVKIKDFDIIEKKCSWILFELTGESLWRWTVHPLCLEILTNFVFSFAKKMIYG